MKSKPLNFLYVNEEEKKEAVGFPSGSVMKNPPANARYTGKGGSILGWEDALEE